MFVNKFLKLFLNIFILILNDVTAKTFDVSSEEYREQIIRYSKSAEIRNYMNHSFDPCNNFYNFTCGNYYKLNEPNMPPYQKNFLTTISEGLRRKFATLLEEEEEKESNGNNAFPIDRKVKDFYKSCLKYKTSPNFVGMKLREIISEFGEMPLLAGPKWSEENFDWLDLVAKIYHKYGIQIILGCRIEIDIANRTVNRLYLTYQDAPLESSSIYTDDVHASLRKIREEVIAKKFHTYFGINTKKAQKVAKEVFGFEKRFYGGPPDEENDKEKNDDDDDEDDDEEDEDDSLNDLLRNYTTIEEMQLQYKDQIDIKRLVNISLGGYIPSAKVYDGLESDAEDSFEVIGKTPKHVLANYIYYQLIDEFIFMLGSNQKETCLQQTKNYFAKVMDNMVYRRYATKKIEQDIRDMWSTLKSAFHSVLKSNKLAWMGYATRSYALEKLDAMKIEINSYANINLTKVYENLQINNQDFMENIKSIKAFNVQKLREKLNQTASTYEDDKVLSFTPVYILTENIIKVPVSMLQPYYLWSDYYPNALKFSTLGFLVSHELIHGFDAEGRFFDKDGKVHLWWDKDSSQYFKNQTKCFSHKYHGYFYNGRLLPELETQSENIADNGGIHLAYQAYLQWYEDTVRTYGNMDMESLPRLNYTSRQLFFISYGQLWCSATHVALRDYAASTDDHVPEQIRVLGPLGNFEEFSKEFNCPIGSYMNPKEKCNIY